MKQLCTSTGCALFLPAMDGALESFRHQQTVALQASRGNCACKFDGQVDSQGQLRLGLRVGTFRSFGANMQARLGGNSPGESFLGTDSSQIIPSEHPLLNVSGQGIAPRGPN